MIYSPVGNLIPQFNDFAGKARFKENIGDLGVGFWEINLSDPIFPLNSLPLNAYNASASLYFYVH